jgi:hypothetical protein
MENILGILDKYGHAVNTLHRNVIEEISWMNGWNPPDA